eukprot:gene9422-11087_t
MSSDRTALLDKLAEYGRVGSFALLEAAGTCVLDVADGGKSCRIPHEIGSSVMKQCVRVLKNSNHSDRKKYVWQILAFMCDRDSCANASELVALVEATDILKQVPKSIASLSAENDLEASGCLQFVAYFGRPCTHRPLLLGRTDGIIESVLHAIDTKFKLLRHVFKATILRVLLAILPEYDPALAEVFLRNDGFRIVNKVFHQTYQLALTRKSQLTSAIPVEEQRIFNSCLTAIYIMFSTCIEIDATTTNLPRLKYSYDPAGFIRTTSALHEFYTLSDDPAFTKLTMTGIRCYLSFVEKVHPESLEFVLLYRGKKLSPTTYSGVPMLLRVMALTRDPYYQHFTDFAGKLVAHYSNRFPKVDEMTSEALAQEPPVVPTSGPDLIVCAFPGRAYNSLSSELLTVVDTSDILGLIAPSVASLSVENDLEGVLCFEFFKSFVLSSGHRQIMVGQAEGLIDAVLRAVEKLFIPARDVVKITLLQTLNTVVSGGGLSCHEKFIQNGAFPIVNTVFGFMYRLGLDIKGGAIDSLCNSALFEFLTVSEDHKFVESTIVLIGKYLSFVEKVHPESLEFVLLYRGKRLSPTTYSGKPMIVHAILITRHTQYQHMAQTATDYMLEYMEMFPSVDTMVRAYLSKEILVLPPNGPAPK